MINEDKLILHSWENWTFLKDGTGNILVRENIEHFAHSHDLKTYVHFVTADGSIDCQNDPSEQESLVAHLHLAEIITALKILGQGGSFVLKIFTFLECRTICHLYLLACAFKKVHLFKPVTSKEGNSEVYVICSEYIGSDKFSAHLNTLLLFLENEGRDEKAMFPLSTIHRTFLCRLKEAAVFFTKMQISIINRNLANFPPKPMTYALLEPRQKAVANLYLQKYQVKELLRSEALFHGIKNQRGLSSVHVDPIKPEVSESLIQRLSRRDQGFRENIDSIARKLEWYAQNVENRNLLIDLYLKGFRAEMKKQYGKPYKYILSSRFCHSRLLSIRHELRELLKRHENHLTVLVKPLPTHHCSEPENLTPMLRQIHALTMIDMEHLQMRMSILCFHENTKNFLRRTDFAFTQKRLSTLLGALEYLPRGNSLFLCSFPLLSRLHVGILFLMTSLFRNVYILHSALEESDGVLLSQYQCETVLSQSMRLDLARIKHTLKAGLLNEEKKVLLEVLPIQSLCCSPYWDSIATYNTFNLVRNLKFILTESLQSIRLGVSSAGYHTREVKMRVKPQDGNINLD